MELQTPTTANVNKQAIAVLSAIPGAMVSDGVVGYLPGGKFGKLGLAVVAAVGAAAVKGKGTGSDVAKGMLVGAAIKQGVDAVREFLAPTVASYVDNGEPSAVKTFVSKAAGLGTPNSAYYVDDYVAPSYGNQPQALAAPFTGQILPLGV